MRFAFTQSTFILSQFLTATAQAPGVVTLPDDISTDHVALSWQPLDAAAAACHTRMRQQAVDRATAEQQAKADALIPDGGKPAARLKPPTVAPVVPVAAPLGAVQYEPTIKPEALVVNTQRPPIDGSTMAAIQTA